MARSKVKFIFCVAHTGEKRNMYRVTVGKRERKGTLGRPRRSWENNIKVVLKELELELMGLTGFTCFRRRKKVWLFENMVTKFRVP